MSVAANHGNQHFSVVGPRDAQVGWGCTRFHLGQREKYLYLLSISDVLVPLHVPAPVCLLSRSATALLDGTLQGAARPLAFDVLDYLEQVSRPVFQVARACWKSAET